MPDEEVIGSGSDIMESRESPTGAELAYASSLDFQITPLYKRLLQQLHADIRPKPDTRTPEEKAENQRKFDEDLAKWRAIRAEDRKKQEEARKKIEDRWSW